MDAFRVIALPAAVADAVRGTLRSPGYGHPAHVEVAAGYGPCRSCLRTFRAGEEERVLFTYDPFDGLDPYPSPGPIFIHRDACPRHDGPGFPEELRALPLTLEGYGADRWIVARERVHDGGVERAAGLLLADARVHYVHVRNTEAGCYVARIERAG